MKRTFLSAVTVAFLVSASIWTGGAKGQPSSLTQVKPSQHSEVDAATTTVPLLRGKGVRAGFENPAKVSSTSTQNIFAIPPGVLRRVPQQYPTIQLGINASNHGDTVLVSEGTYFENIKYRGKKIVVASSYLLDRDTLHIERTIIDGSRPVFTDSGSTVSFVSGEDTNSVLCGFTVRGGYGTYIPQWEERDGGGVFLWESGGRLERNIITGNHIKAPYAWGGGVSTLGFTNVGQMLIMEQNIVSRNTVSSSAGFGVGGGVGIYLSQFRLVGNVFDHDSTYSPSEAGGGAILVQSALENQQVGVISGNMFTNNVAVGDLLTYAGAMALVYTTGEIVISNNVFVDNSATSANTHASGGAMDVLDENATTPRKRITVNTFKRNRASGPKGVALGGALGLSLSNVELEGNFFQANGADAGVNSSGGGIYAFGWGGTMKNNIVTYNNARYGGGISNVLAPTSGVSQSIVNNTVCRNVAEFGGGFYSGSNSTSILLNNIFWDDSSSTGEIYTASTATVETHYSNIEGGWIGGTGNINVNPMFVDSLYRLAGRSPCIAAGIDSIQIGGVWYNTPRTDYFANPRPRPVGTRPDIGAHEFQTTTGVENIADVPATFILSQNYPNPFNPSTKISYSLPAAAHVTLTIYTMLGQKVRSLVNDIHPSGQFEIDFNSDNLPSGVYFYKLTAGRFTETKKMILFR